MQLTRGGRGSGKSTRCRVAKKSTLYISDALFVLAVANLEKQIIRCLKGKHKISALNSLNDIHSVASESFLLDTDRVEAIL